MKFDKNEVELEAKRLRKKFDIETNGIPDIFSFVNSQGIELIRYPFGKDTILGFSTSFEGKNIIISNSSEILSREIYTVAHELGHIVFDFTDGKSIKIDKDNTENSIAEERAYYFADCLLMPEENIRSMLKEVIRKSGNDLRAINIVQMQLEFRVSYNALVERMAALDIISTAKKNDLYSERDFYTSKKLFIMLGAEEDLLAPADKLIVPPQYIDYVVSNYENKYIPLSSLKKALSLVNIDTSDLVDNSAEEDTESIEDLFEEYD